MLDLHLEQQKLYLFKNVSMSFLSVSLSKCFFSPKYWLGIACPSRMVATGYTPDFHGCADVHTTRTLYNLFYSSYNQSAAENPATMVNRDPERPYQFSASGVERRPHTTHESRSRDYPTNQRSPSPPRPPRTAPARLSQRYKMRNAS